MSYKKYDLVTLGAATQDVFVQSDTSKVVEIREPGKKAEYLAFPYGSKIEVQHVLFMTGGGATNVAVAAAKQGMKVSCVASIGDDDAGKIIMDR
jgi:sugar/nucleoside kinase (ribokinase family)